MPGLTREQLRKAELVRTIRKYTFASGLNLEQVAKRAGISTSTLYSRLRKPESFSLHELNCISKAIRIPADELSPSMIWAGLK